MFHDAIAAYPKVSLEEVMARNPEVILDMGRTCPTLPVLPTQHKRDVVTLWDRVATVDAAVKQHRVFAIASDFYIVPGPRVVESARSIFDMLHPEHK